MVQIQSLVHHCFFEWYSRYCDKKTLQQIPTKHFSCWHWQASILILTTCKCANQMQSWNTCEEMQQTESVLDLWALWASWSLMWHRVDYRSWDPPVWGRLAFLLLSFDLDVLLSLGWDLSKWIFMSCIQYDYTMYKYTLFNIQISPRVTERSPKVQALWSVIKFSEIQSRPARPIGCHALRGEPATMACPKNGAKLQGRTLKLLKVELTITV